jgi:3-deoxy-D-manno-octulosonic-acid transferase
MSSQTKNSFFYSACILLWSLLLSFLKFLLLLLPFKKGRDFITSRRISPVTEKVLSSFKDKKPVLLFCSSAGEYEQAKPLISRIQKQNIPCLILFFSMSGYEYAQIQKEQTPYLLAPLDTIWEWRRIFSLVQPSHVMIVRHELWPAFLFISNQHCPIWLVNACQSEKTKHNPLNKLFKKIMLSHFQAIHLVSENDFAFFHEFLSLPKEKLFISGDTKYDRVIERARDKKDAVENIKKIFEQIPLRPLRWVIGSSWPKDLDICFAAYDLYKQSGSLPAFSLVIAPHQPKQEALKQIEDLCLTRGLVLEFYSKNQGQTKAQTVDVLVIDKIGILTESYGAGSFAFVGGAMHHQVHNVLEPASYGLSTVFGPLYKNSQEASSLVQHDIAISLSTSSELCQWLIEKTKNPEKDKQKILDFLEQSLNASNKIVNHLKIDNLDSYARKTNHHQ